MKKQKLLICLFCAGLAAAFWLIPDYYPYHPRSRTISCPEDGLLFSITAFDGDGESAPFVKCLGHAWIALDNRTDHVVTLKEYPIQPGETLTFSIWALSGHSGVTYDLEPAFIREYGRYDGRQSLRIPLDESQLPVIEDYIDRHDGWSPGLNCSRWSLELWNAVTDERDHLPIQTVLYTPKRLARALAEFDCTEENQDFSRAKEIFFLRDGVKTELRLCS